VLLQHFIRGDALDLRLNDASRAAGAAGGVRRRRRRRQQRARPDAEPGVAAGLRAGRGPDGFPRGADHRGARRAPRSAPLPRRQRRVRQGRDALHHRPLDLLRQPRQNRSVTLFCLISNIKYLKFRAIKMSILPLNKCTCNLKTANHLIKALKIIT